MSTAADHPMIAELINGHSRWWHHFRSARWFTAVQSVLCDPQYASVDRLHHLNAAMRRRQVSITVATDDLKTLMEVDFTQWDMPRIDAAMKKIERLVRQQERCGRALLAAAIEHTV